MSEVYEINFDGLVGPTHHYAGLALGNLASTKNAKLTSNPRAAALQGLAKMRLMVSMGLKQGIFLPHPRPALDVLHQLGYLGSEQEILEQLYKAEPRIFSAIFSSSFMWAANAATVTPSSDSADQRVHFTPANLSSHFHRAIEAGHHFRQLNEIFSSPLFEVHQPLPYEVQFSDEGAANHTRLCAHHGAPGLHLFTYGRSAFSHDSQSPVKYPARQTREASETISRNHHLATPAIFLKQNIRAIDAGVFHHDVIGVGNESVYLLHESAYEDQDALTLIKKQADFDLKIIQIHEKDLSLEEAVSSYFFNSQLVTLADQSMMLILPSECDDSARARELVSRLLSENNPINRAEFVDCRQSMLNGGGPACLRLRVVLNERELQAMNPRYLMDEHRLGLLEAWVNRYYRDRLTVKDFLDVEFRAECEKALQELKVLF